MPSILSQSLAIFFICFCLLNGASAETSGEEITFNFVNAEITDVAQAAAKAMKRKLIVSPVVRGKISILLPGPVAPQIAWNAMLASLAINGYSAVEVGDFIRIITARDAQRLINEVATELPDIREEKMMTLIIKLKHVKADDVNKNLRILPSKDGEMSVLPSANTLIFTDWNSNLHRIADLMSKIDVPSEKKSRN